MGHNLAYGVWNKEGWTSEEHYRLLRFFCSGHEDKFRWHGCVKLGKDGEMY